MSRRGRTVRGLVVGVLAAVPLLAAPAVATGSAPVAQPTDATATPTAAASTDITPSPTPSATTGDHPVCAIGDLVALPVRTPTMELTHKPGLPTIGGEGLAGNGLAVPSGSPPLPADLAASSWLVADLDTGEVLGACGAHRMLAPASIQKLLLVATALPELDPADPVVVAPEDLDFGDEWDSKTVPLQVGGTYTVQDLFLGLLLRSGNDAANALARIAGGDRGKAGTIADMNTEARRLGAWDTHAETPSGLDGPGQVSSAYDMALIFRACFGYEDFRRWVDTSSHQMTPGMAIEHDNWEFVDTPGVLGGKAGFTDTARHTFVGAGERDGRRLVATVLGAEVRPARGWQQTLALLNWGFGVPRGDAVGHLVQPGEADQLMAERSRPPSAAVAAAAPAGLPSVGAAPNLRLVVAGVWVATIVGIITLLLALARRRRAALATAPSADTATASTLAAEGEARTAMAGSDGATSTGGAGGASPQVPPPAARPLMGQPPPSPPTTPEKE